MADPILLEILKNHFMGISREMGHVIRSAAHNVFTKETADFGAYLVSPAGEVFMTPDDMGIFITIGTPMGDAIAAMGAYEPGDVCITNDPEGSGGLVTHLPDFFCWRPVFCPGREDPICFLFCFIHHTDVGGLVPGSVSPTAVDQFQEGFILPPSRLVAAGRLNQELRRIIVSNTRVPELNWGDLRAQISGLEVAEGRCQELIRRFGAEAVSEGIEAVLDLSERQARSIIEEIPDGEYISWDYLEGDFRDPAAPPIRIKLRLVIEGSDLTLDFSETDPQVRLALNLATQGKDGHNMVVPALVNHFRSRLPEITYNSGMMRPVHLVVPRGSLLNPEPRAPVGARQATMFRIPEVIMAALAQAVPDQVPACGAGQGAIMFVSAPDFETGQSRVSIVQPLVGGSGGRPGLDATDGVDFVSGFYRNIPTEILESDMPLLVERYGLRSSGAGAGRWRGGLGLDYALRVLSPEATVSCRAMERTRFRPFSRLGGSPGQQGGASLRGTDGAVAELGKIDTLTLTPGEVLEVVTPCGAGFGDPLDRDPALVLADVLDGFVSRGSAAQDYGVALADDAVDGPATAELRSRLRSSRPTPPDLYPGPERLSHEERWPDRLQAAVNEQAWQLPAGLRAIMRERLVREIGERLNRGQSVDAKSVPALAQELIDGLRRRLYD